MYFHKISRLANNACFYFCFCSSLTLGLAILQWFPSFNQFVNCSFCGGYSYIVRSTMEPSILHWFLKRTVLKVFETISKPQYRRFKSKSRHYWKIKTVELFDIFHMRTVAQKWFFNVYIISHWMFVYPRSTLYLELNK